MTEVGGGPGLKSEQSRLALAKASEINLVRPQREHRVCDAQLTLQRGDLKAKRLLARRPRALGRRRGVALLAERGAQRRNVLAPRCLLHSGGGASRERRRRRRRRGRRRRRRPSAAAVGSKVLLGDATGMPPLAHPPDGGRSLHCLDLRSQQ